MRWKCRLEGGPYDGDSGTWDHTPELPESFWVYRCADCKDIHWAPERAEAPMTAVVYDYDRMEDGDEQVAVYIHADSDLSHLPFVRDVVDAPIAA